MGLAVSLALAVLALSGTMLLWRAEVERTLHPAAAAAPPVDAASAGRAAQAIDSAFPGQVRSVTLGNGEFGFHAVSLRGGGGAWVDPRSLQVVDRWPENGHAYDWLFDLHHHLLGGDVGETVGGWMGFTGALLILTGVWLWWPARRLFRLRLTPASGKRTHWVAVHRDLGVLIAPVALLMCLTGFAQNVPDAAKPVLSLLTGGGVAQRPPRHAGIGRVDWAAAVTEATRRFPGSTPRILIWPREGRPAVVRVRQPQEWHANGRTQVFFDPATQGVVGVIDAQRQPTFERVFAAMWPIHASRVGGLLWKLVQTVCGLGLALIAIYGAESYRRRLMQPRRPSRVAAAAPA